MNWRVRWFDKEEWNVGTRYFSKIEDAMRCYLSKLIEDKRVELSKWKGWNKECKYSKLEAMPEYEVIEVSEGR